MIALRLLGPVEVLVDGAPAPPELLWHKNLALLVYLARSPKRTRTREHLIGLLWADKPEVKARRSLNEALRVLRKYTGKAALRTRADQLTLDSRALALDTDEFETCLQAKDWRGACALAQGEFFEGSGVADASDFETWLAAERAVWRRRSVEVLVCWAEALLGAGAAGEATQAAERALALDPTSDAAARAAMRGLALGGNRGAALALLERFTARLARELATTPDAATLALAERVRRERAWVPPPRPTPATAAESRRAPLVGRALELERLLTAWRACRTERRATVAFVEGDAGSGKSRLGDELLARARLDGGVTATARAVEADLAEPESALLGLARGGLLDAPGLAAAPAASLASFAARVADWAERFSGAKPDGALLSLTAAASEVLRAVTAEHPVVLFVDDAEWVDGESLLALGAITRDLSRTPTFLLLALPPRPFRPEIEALRARVRRDLLGVTVSLPRLAEDDLRALARWALPHYGDTEIDRVARRVGTDSAGLPLLAVELYHAVALGLDLKTAKVAWPEPGKTLYDSLPGDLPEAVVGAIRVRFRRLSPDARLALEAAAVLGNRVSAPVLGRATGLGGERLTAALDELEWQGWLAFDSRGYSFVARIVRQVVDRDMVTDGQRQRIREAAEGGGP